MNGVVVGFTVITFAIAVGYGAARWSVGGPTAEYVLNRVVFFITNPALLFTVLARADLRVVFSSFIVIAVISAVTVAALYVLVSVLLFRRAVAETTVGAMASSYVNANNIGIPIAVYVLGNAAYVAPVLLLQLLFLAPIGLTILDVSSSEKTSIGAIVSQPVRNPMIVASAAGALLAVTGIRVPTVVFQPFVLLGGAAVPLVLMAFGMSLHGGALLGRNQRTEILVASVLKSVVMPLVAYLVGRTLFDLHGQPLFAVVVLASLPTAQNIYNFASRYERGEPIARGAVLLTTILSVPVLFTVVLLLA